MSQKLCAACGCEITDVQQAVEHGPRIYCSACAQLIMAPISTPAPPAIPAPRKTPPAIVLPGQAVRQAPRIVGPAKSNSAMPALTPAQAMVASAPVATAVASDDLPIQAETAAGADTGGALDVPPSTDDSVEEPVPDESPDEAPVASAPLKKGLPLQKSSRRLPLRPAGKPVSNRQAPPREAEPKTAPRELKFSSKRASPKTETEEPEPRENKSVGKRAGPAKVEPEEPAPRKGSARAETGRPSAGKSVRSAAEDRRRGSSSPGMSTGMLIGIGAGVLVLAVIGFAVLGGGGNSDAPKEVPKEKLVDDGDKTPSGTYVKMAEQSLAAGDRVKAAHYYSRAGEQAQHEGSTSAAQKYEMKAYDLRKFTTLPLSGGR